RLFPYATLFRSPGRQLVARHGLDGRPRQETLVPVLAQAQHHLAEGQIVVDRGDQPATGRRECGWAAPFATLGFVIEPQRPGLRIDLVAGGQPVDLRRGHTEPGVLHAERLEDAFSEDRKSTRL